MTSSDNIVLDEKCSPVPDLHCVDLRFNTTALYKDFSVQYTDLINKLFDKGNMTNSRTQNTLFIHIEYDTLNLLSFDTFRSLDNVKNRSYYGVSFVLTNRDDQLSLSLSNDIKNMTLNSLRIGIFCGSKGFYQYTYTSNSTTSSLIESLQCEIPTTITKNTTDITILTTTSTRKNRYKFIIIFSLIPCFLLACCLYILYKQKTDRNNERRESIPYSITDTLSSDSSIS